ncbi:helix-turn-helix domain-containing protein [Xanthomonas campestris]|uniref:helix-turn-helix domain-containing protein n=1 Tax=Xanthomonas campestris TaxID=339 RepID=UPI00137AC437|nr:helix-turn-helix transcriptional regulator [Xanthomonas campestris]MDM7753920.1 helix-turn-helix transcriptional regulator [Xanthomonas campestris pv. campestris]MDM7762301.1 helix-turn-helix transcriptional regulator [Xanthomonas campestris pv. campestris]MEB1955757.1 helix-turn-helix transcriptional regulator [Xanthomonas campestris pv. campestris]
MSESSALQAAELVKAARAKTGLSQRAFGARVGKSQGLISKYESGQVAPPASVVIHCMNIPAARIHQVEPTHNGWEAVRIALAQLQKALDEVAPR